MSAIYLDGKLVHYEAFGRGQPIIFLHSWVGSWRYWMPTMDAMSQRFRAYAFDFWGFGESDREAGAHTLSGYVGMLQRFMDELGIQQTNLIGHGLGGMVALTAAYEDPSRIMRVATVGTPIQGAPLADLIKRRTAGTGTLQLFGSRESGGNPWAKLVRQVQLDDAEIQQELYDDTDSITPNVAAAVQKTVLESDLRPQLKSLNDTPILGIYGERDPFVHAAQHAVFYSDANGAPHRSLIMPQAGHFPFIEQDAPFSRLLLDFLLGQSAAVQVKEQWRRRVSQRDYL